MIKRKNVIRLAFLLALTAFVAAITAGLFPYAAYLLADFQYERLVRVNPQTKTEVEKLLFLYTSEEIDITRSALRYYSIKPGEECYQYRILGREPIDAVFDARGNVKTIFCSYE